MVQTLAISRTVGAPPPPDISLIRRDPVRELAEAQSVAGLVPLRVRALSEAAGSAARGVGAAQEELGSSPGLPDYGPAGSSGPGGR